MTQKLEGKKIAILATDGVEQVELISPKQALEDAGAEAHVIAPHGSEIQGWNHHDRGDKIPVDRTLDQVACDDYDALVLPGGQLNPDQLRTDKTAVQLVRAFFEAGKPIAAICHGPWTLIEADVVKGRTVTSWPSLQTDLKNAGANWVDKEVVVDQRLITSRNPDDLPVFNSKMVEEFSSNQSQVQAQAV